MIRVAVSRENERVSHGKGSSIDNFFFAYANFFNQLHIRVPLTEFQTAVLHELNVAPTQLHPNAWATIQAFGALCLVVGVAPIVLAFLYYFDVRPSPKGGWVSLTSMKD